ncbi:MAG: ABC transporter ATP-binding protein [Rhodobacter sp.]|nr:ABC transporter ATP-binding protein [Rhodobacter sp.]
MAEIVIRNLRKEFGDFVAVKESSFTVGDGEFFMLLGPSGCGKTTTLRMIAGLELPTGGQILIDGEDVSQKPASQRDIAFVFQMFALYPHLNVRRNISYPLVSQGLPRAQVQAKVAEVARILGIEGILDKPVGGLSGGDRQRVALGRAIVRSPKAFMMDEPLGALDAEFREHMSEELRALHDRMGATTVYVTHDQLEAMQMGDKIVVMNHGVVEQFGTPQEIYDHPATMFVADFIGSPPMNFLRFEGGFRPGDRSVSLGGTAIATPELRQEAAGRKLALGVRPEHVAISDDGTYRGRIEAVEYLGTTQIVTLSTAHGTLKARTPSDRAARVGETVGLGFAAATLALFDAGSGRAFRTSANAGVFHG